MADTRSNRPIISRRQFAKASALATFVPAPFAAGGTCMGVTACAASLSSASAMLEIRPFQLMCVLCYLGEGRIKEVAPPRIREIFDIVQRDPVTPIRLRANTDSVYRFQNPGLDENTPEGELFNEKRDLDIIQKLGLVPGDSRPAVDMFERLWKHVPSASGICGYSTVTDGAWRGCSRANSGYYEKGHALGLGAVILPRPAEEKATFKQESAAVIYESERLEIRPHHLMCMTCFFGGADELAPIEEDNLFEAIDVVQKNPDIPITLIRGTCMICPPCSRYDPTTGYCLGGRSMALRDQKKDLDVLQKLGLEYGDTLPAKRLFALLYDRISATRDVCGWGDGVERAPEWSVCAKETRYSKGRDANLGIGR